MIILKYLFKLIYCTAIKQTILYIRRYMQVSRQPPMHQNYEVETDLLWSKTVIPIKYLV